MQQEYEIWMEGYSATGDSAGASFLGRVKANSFKEAVLIYYLEKIEQNKLPAMYFDVDRLTYWGCRHFDNEADARKSFG